VPANCAIPRPVPHESRRVKGHGRRKWRGEPYPLMVPPARQTTPRPGCERPCHPPNRAPRLFSRRHVHLVAVRFPHGLRAERSSDRGSLSLQDRGRSGRHGHGSDRRRPLRFDRHGGTGPGRSVGVSPGAGHPKGHASAPARWWADANRSRVTGDGVSHSCITTDSAPGKSAAILFHRQITP